VEDTAITDIGTRLKEARERRKLTLADISTRTKIPVHELDAIEHNDFHRLPGGVFRKAFIRAFAAEVGADGNALASEYRETYEIDRAALAMAAAAAAKRDVSRERWFIGAAACAGVLVAAGLTAVSVALVRQRGEKAPSVENTIESVPTKTRGPALPAGVTSAPAGAASRTAGPATARPGAPLRLEIRVERSCWVSASADGKRVLFRVLAPGERSQIDARDAIDLRVGDAGAVTFLINGAPGRALGASGEVVSVHITPENERTLRADAPLAALRRRG
jgi:cytoskeletal protein RodZ